jgi:hypothetical protein
MCPLAGAIVVGVGELAERVSLGTILRIFDINRLHCFIVAGQTDKVPRINRVWIPTDSDRYRKLRINLSLNISKTDIISQNRRSRRRMAHALEAVLKRRFQITSVRAGVVTARRLIQHRTGYLTLLPGST